MMQSTKSQLMAAPQKKKKKRNISAYVIITICMLLVLFALYIAVITSFMTKEEANYVEFHWIPKKGISLRVYIDAFTKDYGGTNVFIGLKNTLLMYIPAIFVGLYVSAMSGFAFAKMRFPGRRMMYTLLIAGMIIPVSTGTIAKLLIYDRLGWIGTPWPIMVPRMLGVASMIFFLRQFYASVPSDLLEAARIDGASEATTFTRIALPIIKPGIGALAIFTFINSWNDYFMQLIMLSSTSKLTISLGIAKLQAENSTDYGLIMAGAALAAVPIIIVFLAFQKYFTKGITMGAVKG